VKNDERGAIDLADMLRLGWLAGRGSPRRRPGSCGSWAAIGPKLVILRSGLKAQVHAVMAKEGVLTLRAMGGWPRRANHSYDSRWAAELG
jgi:hypothetical protein